MVEGGTVIETLVVGGGGPKGAWSAGVMSALAERGLLDSVKTLWGTSVGAINTALLAGHPPGMFAADIQDLWLSVTNKDVSKPHCCVIPSWWRGGLRSPAPLTELLARELLLPKPGVTHYSVSVDLHQGTAVYSGATSDTDLTTWAKVITASCAHPVWFDPVDVEGHLHSDGGVVDVVPARMAVELGAAPSTTLAISHNHSSDLTPWPDDFAPTFVQRLLREFDIAMHERTRNDIPDGVEVIRPLRPLEVSMPHFRPEEARELFLRGYSRGGAWRR